MRNGRFSTYTPQETVDHEADIRAAAQSAMRGRPPMSCPVELEIRFTFAGDPGAWPTAQRDGDLDNLAKAVLDACNRVVFTDDRLVVRTNMMKSCGLADCIYVRCRAAEPIR